MRDVLQVLDPEFLRKDPQQIAKKLQIIYSKKPTSYPTQELTPKILKPTKSVQFQPHCSFVHEVVNQGTVLPYLFV